MMDTAEDVQLICDLAERLTGANRGAPRTAIIAGVVKLAQEAGYSSLSDYIQLALGQQVERERLLSCLTVHTTSWFRDLEHFDYLRQCVFDQSLNTAKISALSAGCSTGQEAYSLALLLDECLGQGLIKNYKVSGWDIDRICVKKAQMGLFMQEELSMIPQEYHALVQINESNFELSTRIKARTNFHELNLLETAQYPSEMFNVIFCKNILIYLSPERALRVIAQLMGSLENNGLLCVGLGESIELASLTALQPITHSIYKKIR
ncbi:MAG: hypothetical protein NTX25_22650 [Proteobacteria bacterium]|nr:hypothetical protein [Pseudomonadota bacterium]